MSDAESIGDSLARREALVRERERAFAERSELYERRRRVLLELRDDVRDREVTLRARAARLGLDARIILTDLQPFEDGFSPTLDEVALHDESAAILDARDALVSRREAAVARWQTWLDDAIAGALGAEERLVAREQSLADGFRRLIVAAADLDRATVTSTKVSPARRRHHRIEVRVPVAYSGPHEFIAAEAANVSAGGLFVATTDLLTPGRSVSLRLQFPDEGDVVVPGVVAWRREVGGADGPTGFGVRFVDLDSVAERAIGRFVAYRAPLPSDLLG